jgi:hypothetical protein
MPMLLARVTGWRFRLLVGLVRLDWQVFASPLIGTAALGAALLAPDGRRRAARSLDALAEGDQARQP